MALGQVLSREREALNSVGCGFFADVGRSGEPLPDRLAVISVLLVTPDLLGKGVWPVLGRKEVLVAPEQRPYETFRAAGWVGAKVTGSGIVRELLAAYHCQCAWDDWHAPDYLDRLLLPGVPRPEGVILSKRG